MWERRECSSGKPFLYNSLDCDWYNYRKESTKNSDGSGVLRTLHSKRAKQFHLFILSEKNEWCPEQEIQAHLLEENPQCKASGVQRKSSEWKLKEPQRDN